METLNPKPESKKSPCSEDPPCVKKDMAPVDGKAGGFFGVLGFRVEALGFRV